METDRNFTFLGNVDLRKFVICQNKKQIQNSTTFEHRNFNQRPFFTEIHFLFPFNSQTLVTHIEVQLNDLQLFDQAFDSLEIQASSLNNRGNYLQLINSNTERHNQRIICTGSAFTHTLKIGLLMKSEWKKKYGRSNKQLQEGIQKNLSQLINDINVYGIAINSNPSPVLLTKLLNISQSFKKYNMLHQAAQTDLLAALSLISARRFVQASELLRKVSKFYVQKYTSSRSAVDFNRNERSWIRELDEDSNTRNNFSSGRIIQGNKFLQKAAKIQLLLAETISHPTLVHQKLQAYNRCNCYSSGNCQPQPLWPDIDMQDFSITIFSQIAVFLLKMLSDKLQPLRVAALKSIQFFIETLGCTINTTFLQILKQVTATYPTNLSGDVNPSRIPYGLMEYQIASKGKQTTNNIESSHINGKNKILIDHYHHLLETLLSLISQLNKRIVQSIFTDIVVPGMLSKYTGSQLKLYLLRFAEKIISIAGADLVIQVSFVGLLLSFCDQKSATNRTVISGQKIKNRNQFPSTNKHIIYNLAYFSHKILTLLKVKVLCKYTGGKLESFLVWINQTLKYLGQNQMLSNSSNQVSSLFSTLLQFIVSIYSTHKYDYVKMRDNPIQSILYFTNMGVHQNGLPFQQILECLVVVLKYLLLFDSTYDMDKQIASRILQKSKLHNLSLKQLKVLQKILQVSVDDECMLLWLQIFLGSIPHSTFDETYLVFSILIQKSHRALQACSRKQQILNKVVKALLDQYTVKGKAHQQAKQTFITSLLKGNQCNVIDLLSVCLFENQDPKTENYISGGKAKKRVQNTKNISKIHASDHLFDTKSYRVDKELFVEKISFAQLIFTKIVTQTDIQHKLFYNEQFIKRFHESILQLSRCRNWKIKNKSLSLMNYFIQMSANCWKTLDSKKQSNVSNAQKIKKFASLIKTVFSLTQNLLLNLRDSKLMYSVLYNLMNLFKLYEDQQKQSAISEQSYEKMQKIIKSKGQLSKSADWNIKEIIKLFLYKQFLNCWSQINILYNSPWENVRQIYSLLLLEVLKNGIVYLPPILRKRALQMLKPLLTGMLSSNENSERQSALKIFGCLLGLRICESKPKGIQEIINTNLKYVKNYSECVYQICHDWNQTSSQIAEYLCQLCMSKEYRDGLRKKHHQNKKGQLGHDGSFFSFSLGQEMNLDRRNYSMISSANTNNLQNLLLRDSQFYDEDGTNIELGTNYKAQINQNLLNKIFQFRAMIDKDIQARTQVFGQKQSFLEQNQEDQQFYDIGDERAESLDARDSKSEEQQLEFEDLGIIELDDEEWGDQDEKQQKITQKLPLKKIYKLSPNVISSSKPQRIRSKRYHQNQFDYREKIIVDQLQDGKISPRPRQEIFSSTSLGMGDQISKKTNLQNAQNIQKNSKHHLNIRENKNQGFIERNNIIEKQVKFNKFGRQPNDDIVRHTSERYHPQKKEKKQERQLFEGEQQPDYEKIGERGISKQIILHDNWVVPAQKEESMSKNTKKKREQLMDESDTRKQRQVDQRRQGGIESRGSTNLGGKKKASKKRKSSLGK